MIKPICQTNPPVYLVLEHDLLDDWPQLLEYLLQWVSLVSAFHHPDSLNDQHQLGDVSAELFLAVLLLHQLYDIGGERRAQMQKVLLVLIVLSQVLDCVRKTDDVVLAVLKLFEH